MKAARKYDEAIARMRNALRTSDDANLVALEANVTDAQLLLMREFFTKDSEVER